MSALRAVGRWLADWRTGAVLLASLITGAVIALVIVSGVNAHDALEARQQTALAATRRIDKLNDEIAELNQHASDNGKRIGELTAQITALQEQIRRMGGQPIVTATTSTTARRQASGGTTTTSPRSSPAPTSPPPTTTTTTTVPPCRNSVLGICLGG